MGNRKGNFEKFQNSIILKDLIALVVIFFLVYRGNSQKGLMKQNQLDDCKVKILENQGEFGILTNDLVLNIERRALKISNK